MPIFEEIHSNNTLNINQGNLLQYLVVLISHKFEDSTKVSHLISPNLLKKNTTFIKFKPEFCDNLLEIFKNILENFCNGPKVILKSKKDYARFFQNFYEKSQKKVLNEKEKLLDFLLFFIQIIENNILKNYCKFIENNKENIEDILAFNIDSNISNNNENYKSNGLIWEKKESLIQINIQNFQNLLINQDNFIMDNFQKLEDENENVKKNKFVEEEEDSYIKQIFNSFKIKETNNNNRFLTPIPLNMILNTVLIKKENFNREFNMKNNNNFINCNNNGYYSDKRYYKNENSNKFYYKKKYGKKTKNN